MRKLCTLLARPSALGKAAQRQAYVVIGIDTRESGPELASAIAAGLASTERAASSPAWLQHQVSLTSPGLAISSPVS